MSDHLPLLLDLEFNQDFLSLEDFVSPNLFTLPFGNIVGNYLKIDINPDYLFKIDKLYVYNSLGQIVKTKSIDNIAVSIPTYDLANGVYILKASQGKPLKFIVSN
jgi:hypothetical protein